MKRDSSDLQAEIVATLAATAVLTPVIKWLVSNSGGDISWLAAALVALVCAVGGAVFVVLDDDN